MKKKKRIGILGGISYQSTVRYYELIHQFYFEKERDYHYPEIVIFSLDFQKLTDREAKGKEREYVQYVMTGIESLQNAGVDFILMAANSVHSILHEIKNQAKVPLLSMVEAVAERAKAEGLKTLLLMGIKFTMQSSFYQETLGKFGMRVLVPSEREQDQMNRIIFEELTIGVFKPESKKKLLRIISRHRMDGVILGCTELPLILQQGDTKIRLLDTMALHAEAALKYALSS